ncbi:hypothetical protein [Amycolatopsis sp. CA-230715]|uniref:hypothetical protein n=1 Tax=Amycolatopsis sp. CA-230715 TaxID=2745196 RepID=UPI001C0358B6|nr:hypothetical protein [Amycolatopsis sp. CA-230715]QWF85116.1 hypothetical protein HUW46_08570 [Amycolatopsis sp. CA-230715]
MIRLYRVAGAVLAASLVVAVSAAPGASAAPAACTWTQTILPLPKGALTGEVWAADGNGGYAGTVSFGADSPEGGHVVLWKNGKVVDYGNLPLPGYENWVTTTGVNRGGTVVGMAYQTPNGFPSAIRSRDGKLERLPELPGADASRAEGVNDAGDIVGGVETTVDGSPYWNPVIWPADKPGTVVKLAGLPATEASATGIDQDGTVLVEVDDPGGNRVPYLWKDGKARKLSFPGKGYDVVTRGISNGRVIGQVDYPSGSSGGVLWERDGKPKAMKQGVDIEGLNRDGQIVGRTEDPSWHVFGVWKLTALDSTLRYSADHGLDLHVSSDDGTIAGRTWKFPGGYDEPTVWKCG